MWTIRTQHNQKPAEVPSDACEWGSIEVETQEEAELWWACRTDRPANRRGVVHTMWDPTGEVVRVAFR